MQARHNLDANSLQLSLLHNLILEILSGGSMEIFKSSPSVNSSHLHRNPKISTIF